MNQSSIFLFAGLEDIIVCVGGFQEPDGLEDTVLGFDPATRSFIPIDFTSPFAVVHAGMLITDDNGLYLCGGTIRKSVDNKKKTASSSLRKYDPGLKEWRGMASMHTSRTRLSKWMLEVESSLLFAHLVPEIEVSYCAFFRCRCCERSHLCCWWLS